MSLSEENNDINELNRELDNLNSDLIRYNDSLKLAQKINESLAECKRKINTVREDIKDKLKINDVIIGDSNFEQVEIESKEIMENLNDYTIPYINEKIKSINKQILQIGCQINK